MIDIDISDFHHAKLPDAWTDAHMDGADTKIPLCNETKWNIKQSITFYRPNKNDTLFWVTPPA